MVLPKTFTLGNAIVLFYASNKVDHLISLILILKIKKYYQQLFIEENWGDKLYDISKDKKVLDNFPNTIYYFKHQMKKQGTNKEDFRRTPQAFLLEPLSYEKLVFALKICFLVITDSGGLQEEAPALDKPVLVLRNITERQEAIEAGSSKLLGTNSNAIFNGVKSLIMDKKAYSRMSSSINPFGEGDSSKKIFELISKRFNIQN